MKNVISKTKYVLMALIMVVTFSCSPEDGADGAQGPAGPAGQDGTNGQDGNANVQTFTFDTSTEDGQIWNIDAPQLTQDVLDNDGVLTYLRRGGSYYFVPGTSFNDEIKAVLLPSIVQLLFYNRLSGANVTPAVGNYDLLKLVIIESSNTTAGRGTSKSKKQNVFNELKAAGVDVNNYNEVMDYYGLDY